MMDRVHPFYDNEVLIELGLLHVTYNNILQVAKWLMIDIAENNDQNFDIVIDHIPERKYSLVLKQIFVSRFGFHDSRYDGFSKVVGGLEKIISDRNRLAHSVFVGHERLDGFINTIKSKSNVPFARTIDSWSLSKLKNLNSEFDSYHHEISKQLSIYKVLNRNNEDQV